MLQIVVACGCLLLGLIPVLTQAASSVPSTIIEGVPSSIQAQILENLKIILTTVPGEYDSDIVQHIHTEVKESLEPYGYFSPEIVITRNPTAHDQFIITIRPGPMTITRTLNLRLAGPGSLDRMLIGTFSDFHPQVGEVLDAAVYEEHKTQALNQVINSGYPLAHYALHHIEVYPEQRAADIELILDTGDLYEVGQVKFTPSPFDNALLQRFIHFPPRARYSVGLIADLQNSLASSRYIQWANVTPQFDANQRVVPLLVEVEPQKPNQYIAGLGYGTDTGIRARAEWDRRYFNRFGHGLHALISTSQRQHRGELTYIIPGKDPSTDRYEAGVTHFNEHLQNRLTQITEWSVGSIAEYRSWQSTLSARLHNEASRENMYTPKRYQSSLLPKITLSKTKRDAFFNPKIGYKIILSVQGIMDRLHAADNFIQAQLYWKGIIPLRETTSLVVRTELGATLPRDIDDLPLSLRYFAGGDNSIRGFSYKAVSEDPAGGQYLAVGSLELVQKVYGRLSMSAFVDAGSAFSHFNNPWAAGAGLGLRWQSPVGPVRLELARPLSGPRFLPQNWRWHIAFGPEL